MSKQFLLTNKKNGKQYPIDQVTYDKLVKRKHIHNYTVEDGGNVSDKSKYIPAEVKNLSEKKSMSEQIRDEAKGTDAPEPKPEVKLSAPEKTSAKADTNKPVNTGGKTQK